MKRRGLNFISDAVADKLDEEQITTLESEVDNVAPKIVGILGLSASCDVKALRLELVKHCIEYQLSTQSKNADIDVETQLAKDTPFSAYLCPNPGSSTNMGSRKQRMMFVEVERGNEHAVLEVGKVADIMIVVMSCAETDVKGLKVDPDKYSNAIDETGYKALGLLRSQGMPALVGVLQHLETVSSKRQP